MKPGYKTTEFWLSLLAMVVGALLASGAISDGSPTAQLLGTASSILAALGYTMQRGIVKSTESKVAVLSQAVDKSQNPS